MAGRWVYPIDDECPEVAKFYGNLFDDPMTLLSGCSDEISKDFEKKHRLACQHCQEYGAANADVEY